MRTVGERRTRRRRSERAARASLGGGVIGAVTSIWVLGASEADPRVQRGVEDVGDQGHDEIDDADHEHARGQQRKILLPRGFVDEQPDPW